MADSGLRAIAAALGANVGIALTKLVAYGLTGSSSMLAESLHSIADSGNQVLLLVGRRRADRPADTLHAFGFGPTRYLYSFLVAIVLFSVGGLFSLDEAYSKWRDPEPIEGPWWWVPLVVVATSFVLEGFSLRTAISASGATSGPASWLRFVRGSKASDVPVVLLEDSAAIVGLAAAGAGVTLTLLTGDGRWDAAGSAVIGVVLIMVAGTLAREMSSLLIGESATPAAREAISSALLGEGVTHVSELRTQHLGPDELLVVARVVVAAEAPAGEVSQALAAAKVRIRTAVPTAHYVYVEPTVTPPPTVTPLPTP